MKSKSTAGYRGRFAPSPTGDLHSGSLVAALASYLDARAHCGVWLVRIDDIDGPRNVPGAADSILSALAHLGMHPDEPPLRQSSCEARYQHAFDTLCRAGLIYPCGCTRKEIADSQIHTHARHATLVYPGTCRNGLAGKAPRAWRVRLPHEAIVTFEDRWQKTYTQNLATEVGDFVLKRADGQWAYQLAVVVDDADAGITHIVRGADLLDSTARQIYLQRCLGMPTPEYLHVPVVVNPDGEKLSKQTGAAALDLSRPLTILLAAANHLGLGAIAADSIEMFYHNTITAWARRFNDSARFIGD